MRLKAIILSIRLWILFDFVTSEPHNEDAVETRIYKGNKAELGEFPYAGFLSCLQQSEGKSARELRCGGSIIHKNWGLTAAHCIISCLSPTFTVGGIHADGSDGQTIPVAIFYKHFGYKFDASEHPVDGSEDTVVDDYDVALMKLNKSIIFDRNTKEVDLQWDREYGLSGKKGTFLGWGYTDEKEEVESPELLYLESEVLEYYDCYNRLNSEGDRWDLNKYLHVCVEPGSDSKTACLGDSGGPLMVRGYQVGLFIVGVCGSKSPSIFQTTAIIYDWIRKIMITCGDDDIHVLHKVSELDDRPVEQYYKNEDECNHLAQL